MNDPEFKEAFVDDKSYKIYSSRLQELRDSIVLSQNRTKKKTKTKTQTRAQILPYINNSALPNKKEDKLLSVQNRHLRYLFHQFCRQSYIGGVHATFDQISHSSQIMTLNKWMTFCKQFQLTSKLSNRQAMQIFKIATQQRPQMNVFQFCRAIQIVQQKSSVNPQKFATEVLHVNDHLSARNRMRIMKINFGGPKVNYFVHSTLTQNQRQQEKRQVKQFKQKQREYILHQGMFKQQIQSLLSQRKMQRKKRKQNLRNYSGIPDSSSHSKLYKNQQIQAQKQKQRIRKQPLIRVTPTHTAKTKSVFQSYSNIFKTKKEQKNQSAFDNQNLLQSKINDKNLTQRQSKNTLKYQQQVLQKQDQLTLEELARQTENLKDRYDIQIDSDAQSDDILKTHYINEKRIRKNIVKQKPIKVQQQDEIDTDLMITKYT